MIPVNANSSRNPAPVEIVKKWLNILHSEQAQWAVTYLITKGVLNPRVVIGNRREVVIAWSKELKNDASTELFINKMKAAWRQKKYRDGLIEKKSYSFTLDINAKLKLDRLAFKRKKSVSAVLEEIINREYAKATKSDLKLPNVKF